VKKQVNAQMSAEERSVLEAVAFLRGVAVSQVAREALLQVVEENRNNPRVKKVLAERRAASAH
jgi:hypothetical protein